MAIAKEINELVFVNLALLPKFKIEVGVWANNEPVEGLDYDGITILAYDSFCKLLGGTGYYTFKNKEELMAFLNKKIFD